MKARRILLPLLLSALAASAAGNDQPRGICGRLTQVDNLPVLQVWGTPDEAGYAHGYLLAERLIELFDDIVIDRQVGVPAAVYESTVRPAVATHFTWSPDAEAELAGIVRGVADRLGPERARSRKLDRPLDVLDLKAANTLADWQGFFCSTFSAWGGLTADGQTITGRNLDYPATPAMRRGQVLLVHATDGESAWAGLGWPGLIGAYTAMSAEGVVVAMHDAPTGAPVRLDDLTPRALALRQALVVAKRADFVQSVPAALRQFHVGVGSNVHVAGPAAADRPPACVVEYDGRSVGDGVTVRLPDNDALAEAIICTNHMRLRQAPRQCGRYAKVAAQIRAWRKKKTRVDAAAALKAIRLVANSITLHSVVFEPHEQRMTILIPEINPRPIRVELAPLFDPQPKRSPAAEATPATKSES
jgi:hypothetical protein